eukprot:COSAG02_NODE_3538_length_6591_cov_2.343038_1_plen_599_part_00
MLLKLYAFGVRGYWSTNWNRFDVLVVVTSWVDIVALFLRLAEHSDPTPFRVIRILRVVGRITRVFKGSKVLPQSAILIDTFTTALGGMLYVTLFITLILFVFAVIAMNLFGQVALQGCINEYQNFQTVPRGMLTLFGVATGDGFSCMVHSVMVSEVGKSFAVKGACSEELGTCGDSVSARIFFMFFKPIIMFTTIELFVHVVLDRYELLTRMREMKITSDDLSAFVAAWQKIDHEANGHIPIAQVQQVIDELNETARGLAYEPLAGEEPISLYELRLPERADDRMSRFIITAKHEEARNDPKYTFVDPKESLASSPGSVQFYELLYGLCERKCGTPMPKGCAVVTQARANLSKRMPTVAHIFTKTLVGRNTKLADANRARSMEWANPVNSASADVGQDPMSSFAQALFGGDTLDSNGAGSSAASSAKETSSVHMPSTVDVAQALFGDDSGAAGVFVGDSRSGLDGAASPTGNTFDVEEPSQTRRKKERNGKRGEKEPSSNALGVENSLQRKEQKGKNGKKKGKKNQPSNTLNSEQPSQRMGKTAQTPTTFDVEESSQRRVKKGNNGQKGKTTQSEEEKKKSKKGKNKKGKKGTAKKAK